MSRVRRRTQFPLPLPLPATATSSPDPGHDFTAGDEVVGTAAAHAPERLPIPRTDFTLHDSDHNPRSRSSHTADRRKFRHTRTTRGFRPPQSESHRRLILKTRQARRSTVRESSATNRTRRFKFGGGDGQTTVLKHLSSWRHHGTAADRSRQGRTRSGRWKYGT